MTGPDRRSLLAAGLGSVLAGPARGLAAAEVAAVAEVAGAGEVATVRIADRGPTRPISPCLYGSNEVGTLDGGLPSAELDRAARVTARRFGGNLATTYNWTNNASNAGTDDRNANGDYLAGLTGVPAALRATPGSAITHFHLASLDMGAASLVTLPLAGFVAADTAGAVPPAEAAPSRRFVPVRWSSQASASDPVDPAVADIPQLLRRLVDRFGPASGPTGIRAYGLDNEPGLWTKTHPLVASRPVRIADLLARSVAAAAAVKAVDPTAAVVGPASWGATEMATFSDAPDWPAYRHHGSFLAAYLHAFRQASERAGLRLLDALDVHWYPFSRRGNLFRTEDAALASALLDAPRSLSEPGFREDSWVSSALPVADTGGLSLPILPSLERLVAAGFPGTRIAVSEFNYGGAGQLASGLALADALGRLGRSGIWLAAHWGSLEGWLGQAYRLYRDYDRQGSAFGGFGVAVETSRPAELSAFAAAEADGSRLQVVLLNKSSRSQALDLVLDDARPGAVATPYGFDAEHPATGPVGAPVRVSGRTVRLLLPPRSARLYAIGPGTGTLSATP